MPTQTTLTLFKDPLPIPAKISLTASINPSIAITMSVGSTTLDSELPATTIWGYNGTYPGPLLELNHGQKLLVEWRNRLKDCVVLPHPDFPTEQLPMQFQNIALAKRFCFPAHLPITVTTSGLDTQHEAGRSNGVDDTSIANIPPCTIVHLHGAASHPDCDGWTENGILVDQAVTYSYENLERASLYWFHDHAMGITRLNVYAGLAGLYLVRDSEELGLHLPSGNYEIPLVIQDKNLETDIAGNLTGRLLHKTEGRVVNYVDPDPLIGNQSVIVQDEGMAMEFFGPFNLVNGKIAPFLEVKRAVYRFRVVNGSNSRTYKLCLWDDANNTPVTTSLLYQIGSDGGLFKNPVALNANQLILAPGERADIIADFRAEVLKGKKLNWVNIAKAPYDGTDVVYQDPRTLDGDVAVWKALKQKNACVMQFRVQNQAWPINNFTLPQVLANSFVRMTHAA